MSLRAMIWVLEESGIHEHGDFRLMIALADRAHDDGTCAWPSVSWLAERVQRSNRSVLRGLDRLKEQGLIRPGNQELFSHLPANRRPVVYDLVMHRSRGDKSVTPEPVRGDSSDILGVTPDVTQTVPSLLRNETVGEKPSDAGASALDLGIPDQVNTRRRSTALPVGWAPSGKHFDLAQDLGFGAARVDHEAEQFCDRARAKGEKYLDWDAAFRQWLRNARKFDDRSGAARPGRFENAGRDERSGLRVER